METQSLMDGEIQTSAGDDVENSDNPREQNQDYEQDDHWEWEVDDSERSLLQPSMDHHDHEESGTIKRRIGLVRAIAMIVGGIIGSGIFISPRFVLKNAGSMGETLIVWTVGGLLSLLGALCFCELGTLIDKSGGEYIYLKTAYGRLIGFLYSWVNVWFLDPGSHAIGSLTFAVYVAEPFFPTRGANTCPAPFGLVKLLAACAICTLTALNCASIHWAAKAQIVFTSCKLFAIVSIIIVAFIRFSTGEASTSFQSPFEGSATNPGAIGHAFYSAMWAYGGWNGLNSFTEEVKNPEKNFLRTLMISIPLVTLCYVFINLAYFSVLTKDEFLASDAVALTFATRLNPVFGVIMPCIVALSCFGALNIGIFGSARTLFSIARENQLPSCLAMVHRKTQTPIPALFFRATIALLMLLPTNIENLLNWLLFIDWFILSAVFVGLLVLRWKQPSTPRPFKVNLLIPIFMAAVSLYFTATPFISNPKESAFGITVVLAGIPAYYVFIHKNWTSRSERLSKLFCKLSYYIQVILNVVPVKKV